jgi:hypothetical protein
MPNSFAAADPQTVLSSGNTIAILALIIVTLAGVVVYLARKIDKQASDSALEIKSLNAQLFAESKAHTLDYREMARNDQAVLGNTSQTLALFGEKIEVAKGRR